jgi:hypothetical protein
MKVLRPYNVSKVISKNLIGKIWRKAVVSSFEALLQIFMEVPSKTTTSLELSQFFGHIFVNCVFHLRIRCGRHAISSPVSY